MAKKKATKRLGAQATKKKAVTRKKRSTRKSARTKAAKPVNGKNSGAGRTSSRKSKSESGNAKKRLSLLDAAAQVLAKANEPMNTREIVEEVLERNLWTTNGKTPHQTLYSAMLREIQKQGKKSRFKKMGRGRFTVRRQMVEHCACMDNPRGDRHINVRNAVRQAQISLG